MSSVCLVVLISFWSWLVINKGVPTNREIIKLYKNGLQVIIQVYTALNLQKFHDLSRKTITWYVHSEEYKLMNRNSENWRIHDKLQNMNLCSTHLFNYIRLAEVCCSFIMFIMELLLKGNLLRIKIFWVHGHNTQTVREKKIRG